MLVLDTVGDYAQDDFTITAHCDDCRHAKRLILETLPPELKLTDLRSRLRCGVCGSRSTEIRISWCGWDGGLSYATR